MVYLQKMFRDLVECELHIFVCKLSLINYLLLDPFV